MHVQIYGAKTIEDSVALAQMGLDHLGLELADDPEQQARIASIMDAVRGTVKVSLLPLFEDVDAIIAAMERFRPDIVHISNNVEVLDVDEIEEFCATVAPIKVMKSIPVAPPAYSDSVDSVALAQAFDPYVDFLLLDTKLGDDRGDPMPGWIGITGKTHDWNVSRRIVDVCETPVILAGGLDPDNVAEAIEQVRPWGVDACTRLNQEPGKKDLPKCRAFIDNARAAAKEHS